MAVGGGGGRCVTMDLYDWGLTEKGKCQANKRGFMNLVCACGAKERGMHFGEGEERGKTSETYLERILYPRARMRSHVALDPDQGFHLGI